MERPTELDNAELDSAEFDKQKAEELFQKQCLVLQELGYKTHEQSISRRKANKASGVILLFSCIMLCVMFLCFLDFSNFLNADYLQSLLIGCVLLLPSVVLSFPLHDFIHGITWGILGKDLKSIHFCRIKLNPACYYARPLPESFYIAGVLMPCILLGLFPCIMSIAFQNVVLLILGIAGLSGARSDIASFLVILFSASSKKMMVIGKPNDHGFNLYSKS